MKMEWDLWPSPAGDNLVEAPVSISTRKSRGMTKCPGEGISMTIIMFALCPTNVIMGMRVTGYLISGKLGKLPCNKKGPPKGPL